jgi:hypothetical protein
MGMKVMNGMNGMNGKKSRRGMFEVRSQESEPIIFIIHHLHPHFERFNAGLTH